MENLFSIPHSASPEQNLDLKTLADTKGHAPS